MNLPVVTNQNCQFDIYQLPCSISHDYLQDQSRGEKVKMLIYREKICSTIVKLPRPCYQKLVINISEKCILSLCIRSSSRISLTLNAQIATKVVCFSRLLKCLRNLYGKQCGPRTDCSYRSSLFWVHAVRFYT